MASKVQLDLDHSRMKQGSHNGLAMPECYESVADHLPKIEAMEMRPDDVLLTSYPKSGTHWLYRVIDMLQRGHALYDARGPDSTFLDLQQIHRLAELDSPRLLVSHVPFNYLPRQAKDKRTKIVHVYRNPRAVLLSFYFMAIGMETGQLRDESITIDKMADMMFSGSLPYSGWFNYMDAMNAFMKDNPDQPILRLSYEEMSKTPLDTVRKIAEFIGKPGTEQLYSDIVEACSFGNQKQTEESMDPKQASLKFYRKGDMDDWKNHMSVALHEKFSRVLKDRASHCPISAQYQT